MEKSKRDQVVSIIDDTDDMTIATIRLDGFPQATTVSYVNDGLTIYFGTATNSQKAQNIAVDDKVSLTINRPYESWDDIVGLSIGGHALEVTDKTEIEKVSKLLFKKFPQISDYQPSDAGMDGLAIFRINPLVISLLDYSEGFGHTELLKV